MTDDGSGGTPGPRWPGAVTAAGPPVGSARPERTWLRAAALLFVVMGLAVTEPAILVGLPYVLMVVSLPARRVSALLMAVIALAFVLAPGGRQGFWFAERAWAVMLGGWFVALTFRWPESRFSARAFGAVAGSGAVAAVWFAIRPGSWGVLDWLVSERIRHGVAMALHTVRAVRGDEGVSSDLVSTVYHAAEAQAAVFPAMLALASIAALGVAWWVYVRLAHGDGDGLGPVREFRFNDHLVWLLISGLVVLVLGLGDDWSRVGSNAVVFMGALYALRGVAVVMFFYGGLSLLGAVLLALSLLLLAPVIVGGAVVIGLGDTWLDLRTRARKLTGG